MADEPYKGGLKGYWKRRGYHRLDVSSRRRPLDKAELGTAADRRRRPFWRIKISPKLKFLRKISPRRFLSRIRDAYVRMMLNLANSRAFVGYGGYGYGGGIAGFDRPALKEYDQKMLVEIYKSILAGNGGKGIEATHSTVAGVDLRR